VKHTLDNFLQDSDCIICGCPAGDSKVRVSIPAADGGAAVRFKVCGSCVSIADKIRTHGFGHRPDGPLRQKMFADGFVN
jgi:hypothetical protein